MKKIVSILTVLVLLVGCLAVSAFAAEDAVLTVESKDGKVGDTVTLNVTITEATFRAYGLKLVYDNAALELVEIKAGELSKAGMFSAPITSGIVGFVGSEEQTAAGVLFTATFKVLAIGEHEVKAEIDGFTKSDNTNINVVAEAGKISVACDHKWEVTGRPESESDACFLDSKCQICGESKHQEWEAHNWELVAQNADGSELQKCVNCGVQRTYNPTSGDMIGVVIALLAVSGLGITVLRKREN